MVNIPDCFLWIRPKRLRDIVYFLSVITQVSMISQTNTWMDFFLVISHETSAPYDAFLSLGKGYK